jgi:hypothetical protein
MEKKQKLGLTLTVFTMILVSAFGINQIYFQAYMNGYHSALIDVSTLTDIDFSWNIQDGKYTLSVYSGNKLVQSLNCRLDIYVEQRDQDGNLKSLQRGAGVLTTIGKDFIEQQISGSASTTVAKYISCSASDTSGLSVASTQITSELDANGFTRATGTYASTGYGAWNVTYTFISSGVQAVQSYGLQWSATKQTDNNLLCYDSSAVKNTVAGDTLKVTWQCSVT